MPKSASDKRHFYIAGVLVIVVAAMMDWLLKRALPLPAPASVEAGTIDQLFGWHMTLIAILFALVMVFMVYAIVVFRKREGDESEGEHFEGNTTLEIAWTAIPLVLVVIFMVIGIRTLNTVTHTEENEVVIKAIGKQWAWQFVYPNGTTSTEELVLPVGRRVQMRMWSNDVLHAFWIPELRVKQDILPVAEGDKVFAPNEEPAHPTVVRFTPTMTNAEILARDAREPRLVCAELCGNGHYNMFVPVRLVPEAEFIAWMDSQLAQQKPQVASAGK